MMRILCVAVVMSAALLAGARAATAGMSEGVAAVTVGDYPKAIAEFQPLAASGDPAAQYQLAKLYLEGHGPADGVPQGIELMTKAANGGHPEAQAQLGLMYAMGLGVPVDNVKAYDWLSKAVSALPDGTRRTVAEANRDAVLKRMNASQQNAVAATTSSAAASGDAAGVQDATPTGPAQAPETAKKAETAPAKPVAATTAKTVSEAAQTKQLESKPATGDTGSAASQAKPAGAAAKVAESKPASAETRPAVAATAAAVSSKPADESAAKAPDKTAQAASAKAPDTATPAASAKTPETATQMASAKAPEAGAGAAAKQAPTGIRIQLISMPTEEAAWNAWKQLSGKYAAQLSGLTPLVETADLGTKGTFYRVQTGPFDSVAKAQERCSAMKQAGLDCLVVGRP